MTDHRAAVVVGFDGGEHSRACVLWAAEEADRQSRRLVVLAVEDYAGLGLRGPVAMAHLWAQEARRRAQRTAEAGAVVAREARPRVIVEAVAALGAPARALNDASVEAALIVVGTRGRSGLAELTLGSVAEAVAGRCSCPVVVVRAGSTVHPGPSRGVVVGVDGSPGGLRAVDVGCDLATATRASLTVVSAWLPSLWSPSSAPSSDLRLGTPASQAASEVVHDAVARARTRHPTLEIAGVDLQGPAVAALVHQCSGAGLLVVGSEGHGGRRKALLGSVSRAVARIAPCPVVVIGPHHPVPTRRSGVEPEVPVTL